MKTLVLVFHPHLEKSQVNRKLMDAANETGDVTVVDEYAAYPDFKINVEHEQELIETHDRIVLQFPFYWYSSPALLKQWEDDVIKAGWAYGGGRALEGKEFMLAVSTGSPADSYTREGSHVRTMEELLSIIKGPDFPTGAEVLGKAGIDEAYRTGRGKIRVRAVSNIETMPNGKSRIIVTELPYAVNKARLIEKIAELVKDKKLDGITDLRDESNREGLRICIELRRDVNANVIMNRLLKAAGHQVIEV